jgi:hypothetical protein
VSVRGGDCAAAGSGTSDTTNTTQSIVRMIGGVRTCPVQVSLTEWIHDVRRVIHLSPILLRALLVGRGATWSRPTRPVPSLLGHRQIHRQGFRGWARRGVTDVDNGGVAARREVGSVGDEVQGSRSGAGGQIDCEPARGAG